MKKQFNTILALLILIAGLNCSKSGGDNPTPPPPPAQFTISNLQYDPATASIRPHLASFYVNGTITYANAKNGISLLRIQTSQGADLTVPVPGVTQSSGTIMGVIEIAMPSQPGTYTFTVWLVDGNGTSSNSLKGTVTMTINDAAQNWYSIPAPQLLNHVFWANNRYLAVGHDGKILSSWNGANWTEQLSVTNQKLFDACWTDAQYIAVGAAHTILTSQNGVNWIQRSSGIDSIDLFGVAGQANKLVAVGVNHSSHRTVILNSQDGVHWTYNSFSLPSGELNAITWSGSQFVAVGKSEGFPVVITSPDGISWTYRAVNGFPGRLQDVVWSGNRFIAVGDGVFATSPEGVAWTYYNPGYSATGVTWSGNRFVAVCESATIISSVDGLNWTQITNLSTKMQSIAWSGLQYVAVSNTSPVIMFSPF